MATKTAPINMRVEPSVRDIIDAAANLMKLDRTVFIQKAALAEAHEIIANQRDFILAEKAYAAFEEALKAEPIKDKGMNDLLNRKSPWE
jgi:uncharacterized protein (DUF1778 family)